jgi:hypothetical protein
MIKGIINNATAVARRQVMVVMGLVVDQEPWRSTDCKSVLAVKRA